MFEAWLKGSRLRQDDGVCRVLGRRRQPREEHQPQSGPGPPVCQACRRDASSAIVGRDGGYTAARRRRLRRSCRPSTPRPSRRTCRGVSGRGLAPARVASQVEDGGDEVGIDPVTPARGLPRPRRRDQPRRRARRQAVSAQFGRGSRDPAGRGRRAARLRSAGFALIVVTNQPDVARGRQQRAVVEAINTRLAAALPLDEFRVCYHDDGDGCGCRKPPPGS